jgi:general stress protein 26
MYQHTLIHYLRQTAYYSSFSIYFHKLYCFLKANGINEVYFTTNDEGNKAKRILKNGKASVCVHKGADNITLIGDAVVLTDKDTKRDLWRDWMIAHFPGGEDDPSLVCLKFTAKRASLWVEGEAVEFEI